MVFAGRQAGCKGGAEEPAAGGLAGESIWLDRRVLGGVLVAGHGGVRGVQAGRLLLEEEEEDDDDEEEDDEEEEDDDDGDDDDWVQQAERQSVEGKENEGEKAGERERRCG